MKLDVVLLPSLLESSQIAERAVAVFDVLRATTTMTAALEAGIHEILVFDSIDTLRSSTGAHRPDRLLCGELKCLPPEGFDLGNSPGAFSPSAHRGKILLMATTNGTRAICAASGAH